MTQKAPHISPQLIQTMSKQVLISMLRQGNTGAEILSILDAISSDAVSDAPVADETPMPTLEFIEF